MVLLLVLTLTCLRVGLVMVVVLLLLLLRRLSMREARRRVRRGGCSTADAGGSRDVAMSTGLAVSGF